MYKKLTKEELNKIVIEYKKKPKDFFNLRDVILLNVDLTNDELNEVGSNFVELSYFNGTPVDLSMVTFRHDVYLIVADLVDAHLVSANLAGAHLVSADFKNTI